ncbi:MAG TPA: NADH-quinone oxidoreductase subunit NuoH [Gemmatimonadota bacterium]|nr:NADH-quinone oxidoreductase subunit NuoH [Gemmatimonadota bacterium]
MDWTGVGISFLKAFLVFFGVVNAVPVLVWAERRGSAFIQHRLGPNRVNIGGFTLLGLVQPLADVVKFIWKEDYIPSHANRAFYILAPVLLLVPAAMTFAVVPFADVLVVGGREIQMQVAHLDIGILYVFALASLSVYGIVLAGWSSNNKYSLLGGIRASAQMISYELALGLSVVGILMIYRSVGLDQIVHGQGELLFGALPKWGVVTQPLAFVLFLAAVFAESNRLPFDLPEAENELVVGYHTEYSSMKFALFFMAEYMAMVTGAMLIVTLFFGGWQIPWVSSEALRGLVGPVPAALLQIGSFSLKLLFFLWLFIWVRWTLPRFRYDQLMQLGWKVILPLALANVFVTGLVLYLI